MSKRHLSFLVLLIMMCVASGLLANEAPTALTDTGTITMTLVPQTGGQQVTDFDVTLVLKDDWAQQAQALRTSQQTAMTTETVGTLKIADYTFVVVPSWTNEVQPRSAVLIASNRTSNAVTDKVENQLQAPAHETAATKKF